jgi:allantoin racemase
MHLKVVNPNTSWAMTESIGTCARAVAGPGTRIEAVSPAMGPVSIESHYDEALSVPGLLTEIASGEQAGADAYVIACFGDPGLDAARELATGPVIGVAQAAMHAASLLGRGFTVVTTLERTVGRAWDLAEHYGFGRACRSVHACDLGPLELDTDPRAAEAIVAVARHAVAHDRSDALVLGCAGMGSLARRVAAQVDVPVVEGVGAAVLLAESLVRLGLRTNKTGEFARPVAKPYAGDLRRFGADISVVA